MPKLTGIAFILFGILICLIDGLSGYSAPGIGWGIIGLVLTIIFDIKNRKKDKNS